MQTIRSHRLEDLSWREIAEVKAPEQTIVLPFGATEQHGPALAQRTDTTRAAVVADRVAERMSPRVLIGPAIPVGVSEHHMAFPGTLTLSPSTLQHLIRDLVSSVYRHGWRRVFLLTGHGGNDAAIGAAASQLRAEFPDLWLAWSGVTSVASDIVREHSQSAVRGHSCEIETAQALATDPTLVLTDRLARGAATTDDLDDAGRLSRSFPGIHFPLAYRQLSPEGNLGDGTLADRAVGEQIIDAVVDRISTFIDGLSTLPARDDQPMEAEA